MSSQREEEANSTSRRRRRREQVSFKEVVRALGGDPNSLGMDRSSAEETDDQTAGATQSVEKKTEESSSSDPKDNWVKTFRRSPKFDDLVSGLGGEGSAGSNHDGEVVDTQEVDTQPDDRSDGADSDADLNGRIASMVATVSPFGAGQPGDEAGTFEVEGLDEGVTIGQLTSGFGTSSDTPTWREVAVDQVRRSKGLEPVSKPGDQQQDVEKGVEPADESSGVEQGGDQQSGTAYDETDTRRIPASKQDPKETAEAGESFEQPITRRISGESKEAPEETFDDETTRRVSEEVAAFPDSKDPEKVLDDRATASTPAASDEVELDASDDGKDSSWGDEPTQKIETADELRVEGPVAFIKQGSGPKILTQESFEERYQPEVGVPASVDVRSAEQTRPEIRPETGGFEEEPTARKTPQQADRVEPDVSEESGSVDEELVSAETAEDAAETEFEPAPRSEPKGAAAEEGRPSEDESMEEMSLDEGVGLAAADGGSTSLLEDSDAEFFSDVSVHDEPGALGESEAEISAPSEDNVAKAGSADGMPAVSRPDTDNVGLAAAESELEWEAAPSDSIEALGDGAQTDEIAALLDGPNSNLVEASASVMERRSWAESTSEADELAVEAGEVDDDEPASALGEEESGAVSEGVADEGAVFEAPEGFDWNSAAEIVDGPEGEVEPAESDAVEVPDESDVAELGEQSDAVEMAEESESAEMGEESESAEMAKESDAVEMAEESESAEMDEESESAEMAEESESEMAEESDAVEMAEESDAVEMAEESDAVEMAEESDAEMAEESEAVEIAEDSDAVEMAEESESAEMAEESDAAEVAEESDAAEMAEESDAVEMAEESEAVEMAEESEAVEMAEESDAVEMAEDSDAVEMAEESDAAEMAEESESAEMAEESESEMAEESDAVEMAEGSDAAEVSEESDAAEMAEESESAEVAEESDASELAEESESAETAEESDAAEMAEESESAEIGEESESAEIGEESESAEIGEESDAVEMGEESDAVEMAEGSDAAEVSEESDAAEMAEESDAAEMAEESDAAEVSEESESAEMAEESDAAEMAEESDAAEVAEESDAAEMAEESDASEITQASEPLVSSNSIVEEAENDEDGVLVHGDEDYELVEVAESDAESNDVPDHDVDEDVAAMSDPTRDALDSPDFRALGAAASNLFEAVAGGARSSDESEGDPADEAADIEAAEISDAPASEASDATEIKPPNTLAKLQTKKVRMPREIIETSRAERLEAKADGEEHLASEQSPEFSDAEETTEHDVPSSELETEETSGRTEVLPAGGFTFRSPTEGRMRKPNLPADEDDFDPREVAELGVDDSIGVLFEEIEDDETPADPFASRRPVSAQSLREQFFGEVRTSVGVTSVDKGLPQPSQTDTRPKKKPNPLFKKLVQGRIPSPIKASDTDVDVLEQENVLSNFRDRFEKKKAEMKAKDGSKGDAPMAQVLKPAKVVREERRKAWLRERVAPSRVDKPKISDQENLVMTRQVEVKAKKTEYQETVRVPVLSDFNQRREESGSGALVNSENEILRLYRDFMIVMRRCGLATRPIDFASFADKVSDQRERARRKYGADNLVMEVKVTSGKPVISIRPK